MSDDDVRREIEQSNAAFSAAIRAQDLDRIAAAYTEDAVLLLHGAPEQLGRDAVKSFFRGAFTVGLESIEFSTQDVQPFGQVAVERGSYAMTLAGGAPVERGRYLVVHQRGSDGVWRARYDVTQRFER